MNGLKISGGNKIDLATTNKAAGEGAARYEQVPPPPGRPRLAIYGL